ncbi:hypothetical protein VSDG_03626 [Cytospora chrysosperma]|uniref:Uncharacterized protein n=1 Tax=Cytospora chrysosperma TaxID=252740 RepID=A0A423WA87_CYTCH|nr:hypothetical protein VSDG_03626 [Valsa sordida]
MPSLLSFSRLRPQRSHYQKTDAAVLPKEEVGSAIHPKSTASLKVTEADVDNSKRIKQQLPDRAMLAQLREALKTISDVLSEVDHTVLDILDGSDEGLEILEGSGSSTSPVNALVLSIDLHLADLQRSSSALCKLVSKCHAEKRIEGEQPIFTTDREVDDLKRVESPVGTDACLQFEPSSHQASTESLPDPVTPDQDPHYYLPTPEFSNFSFSPYQFTADDTACSHDVLGDLAYSPPPLQVRRQRPSSPSATPLMSIAPLKLPLRSLSSESVPNLRLQIRYNHRRAVSSPFDYELGYLDGQISETSGLDRRHSSNLGQLSPMIQRSPILRNLKPIDSYRSALESHPGPRTPGGVNLSGSPQGSRLSSESRYGLEPIGEVDFDHSDAATHSFEPVQYSSTQFSTEEKTRRLRARRRGSELSCGLHADSHEPLSMEELMEFLRQGNSIRQL